MRIKLLENRTGPRVDQQVDDVIDVDDREARRMIAAGQAQACDVENATGSRPVQAAVAAPQRAAVRRR